MLQSPGTLLQSCNMLNRQRQMAWLRPRRRPVERLLPKQPVSSQRVPRCTLGDRNPLRTPQNRCTTSWQSAAQSDSKAEQFSSAVWSMALHLAQWAELVGDTSSAQCCRDTDTRPLLCSCAGRPRFVSAGSSS